MKTLTVFTPTYNRKHTLWRTYESLCRQTCKDFDWLVIDDGSSDGTREWVASLLALPNRERAAGAIDGALQLQQFDWMGRPIFSEERRVKSEECLSDGITTDHFFIHTPDMRIEYIWKENGGLYTGYNVAYQTIETELCVCIDSDDYMPDDAVEKIVEKWNGLSEVERNKYCGIVGLDFDVRTKEPIGGYFKEKVDEACALELDHVGDTKYVFRTELMREVAPMIGFEGEKDFNPHYMQMQVIDKYPIMVMNDNLCWVEYQIGGDSMSQAIFKQYVRSPNSYAKYRLMEMKIKHGMTWKRRLMLGIHYVSSCIHSKNVRWLKNSENGLMISLLFPFGLLLSLYVRQKAKK